MEKRKRVSSNIRFRKYFLSWIILIFAYLITNFFNLNQFWDIMTWTITILASLFFLSLKKVEFTENAVYFDNEKTDYESIKELKTFEFQQRPYYLYITDSKNFLNKYHITQLGGINYFGLLKSLLTKDNEDALPLAEFLNLLDQKSSINKDKLNTLKKK